MANHGTTGGDSKFLFGVIVAIVTFISLVVYVYNQNFNSLN